VRFLRVKLLDFMLHNACFNLMPRAPCLVPRALPCVSLLVGAARDWGCLCPLFKGLQGVTRMAYSPVLCSLCPAALCFLGTPDFMRLF